MIYYLVIAKYKFEKTLYKSILMGVLFKSGIHRF